MSFTKILGFFTSRFIYKKTKKLFFFAFYAKKGKKSSNWLKSWNESPGRPSFFWYFLNIFVNLLQLTLCFHTIVVCFIQDVLLWDFFLKKSWVGELYWTSLLCFALLLLKGKPIWSIFTNPMKLKQNPLTSANLKQHALSKQHFCASK